MKSKHLVDINADYYDHMWFSLTLSGKLITGSVKALVHAFLPDQFITSTTDTVSDIQERLDEAKTNGIQARL